MIKNKIALKQKLILLLLSTLTFNQAVAKSDIKNTEGIETKTEKHENHSKHQKIKPIMAFF